LFGSKLLVYMRLGTSGFTPPEIPLPPRTLLRRVVSRAIRKESP
jgi:hypothetical protein